VTRGPAYWVAVGAVTMLIAITTCTAVAITVEHNPTTSSQSGER
jgi:hypothetical protein